MTDEILYLDRPDGSRWRLDGPLTATQIIPPSPLGAGAWENLSAAGEPYWRWANGRPTRMIVFLHSWSATRDQVQAHPALKQFADCALVAPDFGGANNSPSDGGDAAQTEKVARVINATKAVWPQIGKVALVGYSGGGFVGLMVLAHYPGLATGACLWNGMYDLAAWWAEADAGDKPPLEACCGGPLSNATRGEYLRRSPRWALDTARDCTVILNSGEQDDVVPHHHRVEVAARLKGLPGMTVTLNSYPLYGHEFGAEQEAITAAQLPALL